MIKYLIAFMLFTSPCLAGMGIGGFPYPGPGMVVGASSSSAITFYTNADSITSGQSPTVGSGTITMSGVSSVASTISNGWGFTSAASASSFPVSGNFDKETGTIGFYLNVTNWGTAFAEFFKYQIAATPYWRIGHSTSSGTLVFSFGAETISIPNATVSTGNYIQFAWSKALGKAAWRVNNGAWTEATHTVGTFATNDIVSIGPSASVTNLNVNVDQIIISSTYQDAEVYNNKDKTTW